tara:strand:+ start:1453 stop:1902 length:450 start_codon:yes stop_codon:yes gene_type:complete
MSNATIDYIDKSEEPTCVDDLTDVVARLTENEAVLATELQQLALKTNKLTERLIQVQTALAALRGELSQTPAKSTARSQKDTVSEAVILKTLEAILKAEGPMSQSHLLSRLKQQLLSQGLSRVGVKPMMVKALTHQRFKIDHDRMVSFS